ncbi:MAG: hypothetical protein LIP01_10995, partial [Tannerellaceae bacterium]|nr:hypothetical protein [Tannerellaceae bacterium]
MSKYDIQIRKLVFILLPTFLRKPILVGLPYSIVTPVCEMYTRFLRFREDSNYRMTYNGQICYLKAVLNDHFDPVQRRINISDEPGINNALIGMRGLHNLPPV